MPDTLKCLRSSMLIPVLVTTTYDHELGSHYYVRTCRYKDYRNVQFCFVLPMEYKLIRNYHFIDIDNQFTIIANFVMCQILASYLVDSFCHMTCHMAF